MNENSEATNSSSHGGPTSPIRGTAERIMWLASLNRGRTYLEIGVSKGKTFHAVDLGAGSLKLGVDPKFQFDTKLYASDTCLFFPSTSDEFFSGPAHSFAPFDIVFIDGLHTFEQTFRDFCASQSFTHGRTIWLIDDIGPKSLAQAETDFARVKKLKRLLGEDGGAWMGDVYKMVAAINDYFPQLCWAILPGHAQMAVWKGPRRFSTEWKDLEEIARLTYADYLLKRDDFFSSKRHEEIQNRILHSFGEAGAQD